MVSRYIAKRRLRREQEGPSGWYDKNLASQGKPMQRKILRTIALASFALVVGLGAAGQAQAQDVKAPYPNMVPLDQYLMERNAEIALARSAPPESIPGDAGARS